jgi:hypothetical protein
MTKISISYRRKDSDAITGRIFDRLVAHYGIGAVFRDIDNIPPGYDFRKYIGSALENTDILLAIVGPQWSGKTDGRTRIHEVTDLVRIEIEAALRRDIPVVPLLVGNASMPDPSELPDGLKDFAFRNAVKVDALEDFDDHVKRLIRSLDRLLETRGHVVEEATAAARVPQPDIDNSPGRSAPDRSSAVKSGGGKPDGAAGRPAPGDTSSGIRASSGEHARPSPDRPDASRAAMSPAQFQASTSIGPLLILPGIVVALYVALYITGIWSLGQTSWYTPAYPLAQAGLFSFCMARYGRVGAAKSLLGGAALWFAASVLLVGSALTNSTMIADIPAASRPFYVALNGIISATLLAAVLMAIGMLLCPVLGRRRYLIAALVGYPLLSFAASSAAPAMIMTSVDRSSLAVAFFAALVVKQVAIFACLGLWVSGPSSPAGSASHP